MGSSQRLSFTSDGHNIPVDVITPGGNGRHPAVLVLHGSTGMWDPVHNRYAQQFSRFGYVVFLVHYFERTGTARATDPAAQEHFPAWMRTVSDAITFAAQHPGVDPGRIALLGFSLGAYLALSVAAVDRRVKAVVDFFGGLPAHFQDKLEHMPPVLILHGEADRTVPVDEAYALEQVLRAKQFAYEIKTYPRAGHVLNLPALLDAGQRTVRFLKRNLG